MNITFDAPKDAANVAKHGVSFAQAKRLNWDWLCCAPDVRRDYGERRNWIRAAGASGVLRGVRAAGSSVSHQQPETCQLQRGE